MFQPDGFATRDKKHGSYGKGGKGQGITPQKGFMLSIYIIIVVEGRVKRLAEGQKG
jgi:hypothetical protein